MAKIFHVIPQSAWTKLKANKSGFIEPDSLKTDGFVHCCKADQLSGVIDRFFSTALKLVVLRINESNLEKEVIYEAPAETPNSGLLFPHYYGPIPVESVEKEFFLSRKALESPFSLPDHLLS